MSIRWLAAPSWPQGHSSPSPRWYHAATRRHRKQDLRRSMICPAAGPTDGYGSVSAQPQLSVTRLADRRLLQQYGDDGSATWLYTWALWSYRQPRVAPPTPSSAAGEPPRPRDGGRFRQSTNPIGESANHIGDSGWADLFASRTLVALLTRFLLRPDEAFYQQELATAAGTRPCLVQRELARLERALPC